MSATGSGQVLQAPATVAAVANQGAVLALSTPIYPTLNVTTPIAQPPT
jgi:hypothetical protein